MEKIKVSKVQLLEKLYENRDIHVAEYKEVREEYQKDVVKELRKLAKTAQNAKFEDNIDTHVSLKVPKSYESDYDTIIGMLEFSIEDTFSINQDEYKMYVLNEWYWSGSFEVSKRSYMKGM